MPTEGDQGPESFAGKRAHAAEKRNILRNRGQKTLADFFLQGYF
jgi:hypothetical protein